MDELHADVEALQRLFWKQDRQLQEAAARAQAEAQLRERLGEEAARLREQVRERDAKATAALKSAAERSALMQQVLQLQERLAGERERFAALHARCAELGERAQERQERIAELTLEIAELRSLRDMADKKLTADNLRSSRAVAELEERLARAHAALADADARHRRDADAARQDYERQILQMASTGGRGADAVQLYRAKLLAHEEEIQRLRAIVDQRADEQPAASSAPPRPAPARHDRFTAAQRGRPPVKRTLASYGNLLQSSSDEDADVLAPRKEKRLRR